MSERCAHCGKPIELDADVEWVDTHTANPLDSILVAFHRACWDTVYDTAYQEWCEEQRSLKGYSDKERERI